MASVEQRSHIKPQIGALGFVVATGAIALLISRVERDRERVAQPNNAGSRSAQSKSGEIGADRAFNEADEIADRLDMIDLTIRDLDRSESIFDGHHEFDTIEPISAEIVDKVSFIHDAFELDAQAIGDDRANLVGRNAFSHRSDGRRPWHRCPSTDSHDEPLIPPSYPTSNNAKKFAAV